MARNELKHLSRAELLEMLIEQSKEVDSLRKQLDEANAQLESRRILLQNTGSIAQAALALNGVFEAAQKAADQYLDNIRELAAASNSSQQNEPACPESDIETSSVFDEDDSEKLEET